MASPPWLLRVVPDDNGREWNVVQPRTGRTLGASPTQDLAVEQALARLTTGGSVQVVVDGFMVRHQVVLPPPVPRSAMVVAFAVPLAVGALMAILLGPVLHSSVLVVVLGAFNSANIAFLLGRWLAVARSYQAQPDLALIDPSSPQSFPPADRSS